MTLKGIDDTLDTLLSCVDDRLKEANVPTCVVARTIGDPVIMACPECAGNSEGELWGHLLRVFQGSRENGSEVRNRKPCTPGLWYAQYRITLARCFPTIDAQGDLPDPVDRTAAASALHSDAALVQVALNCCTKTDEPPFVESIAVNVAPAGGVSILTATLRIPVSMALAANVRSSA